MDRGSHRPVHGLVPVYPPLPKNQPCIFSSSIPTKCNCDPCCLHDWKREKEGNEIRVCDSLSGFDLTVSCDEEEEREEDGNGEV